MVKKSLTPTAIKSYLEATNAALIAFDKENSKSSAFKISNVYNNRQLVDALNKSNDVVKELSGSFPEAINAALDKYRAAEGAMPSSENRLSFVVAKCLGAEVAFDDTRFTAEEAGNLIVADIDELCKSEEYSPVFKLLIEAMDVTEYDVNLMLVKPDSIPDEISYAISTEYIDLIEM